MATNATLKRKVETAIANFYITSSTSGVISSSFSSSFTVHPLSVFRGEGNDDKSAPCIIVHAERAREEIPYTGVFHIPVVVKVKEVAADTLTSNLTVLADKCFELLMNLDEQTLAGYQTEYSGSLNIVALYNMEVDDSISGDCTVNELRFEIVATG